MEKYKCVCCGNYTLDEEPPGTYLICSICDWEDDIIQYDDPNYQGGANRLCLNSAKEKYRNSNNISVCLK